jgi:hypothetical protein
VQNLVSHRLVNTERVSRPLALAAGRESEPLLGIKQARRNSGSGRPRELSIVIVIAEQRVDEPANVSLLVGRASRGPFNLPDIDCFRGRAQRCVCRRGRHPLVKGATKA